MSQAGSFNTGVIPPGSFVETLTGNSGGAVGPDGSGNINVVGDGTIISFAGNPGTNTLTGTLSNGSNGQLLIGGGAAPAWNSLTSNGSIAFTPTANHLAINTGGSVATSYTTDTTPATPSGGILQIAGGSNINTSGALNVVTINLDNSPSVSGTLTAVGNIRSSAGNVIASVGYGEFVTLGVGAVPVTSAVYVNSPNRIGVWVTGSNVSAGSDADGIFVDASFAPSANITNAASIGLYPTFNPPGGVTITTGYGLYIASGTQGGAGSVTTGYGLYVTHPTFGTTNYAAQIDNIRIDVNTIAATNSNGTLDVNSAGTGTLSLGTNATAHATIVGSTTASATTTIQAPTAGVILTGVQGVAVANKNYVTINTATGAIGSDTGPASSISITGDTGGALTGSSFTFTGGTTGLSFGGSGSTETLTFAGITANGGTVSLATDATTSTINVGTGGGIKTSTFGSTFSTSATTLQSGSGALAVTSTNGTLTINSGTGALGISTDASATTLSIGTGGAVKGITIGSTSSTSTTTIACGTGGANFGTSANAHATTVGSTTASATTTIQGPSAGVFAVGVAGVTPSNKNMVTINTSTGQLGSEAVPSGMTWSVITADQSAVAGNGYICNKGSALLLTLPASAAIGDTISVTGINTALGWKIVQNANQQIHFGTSNTTSGATGYLQSSNIRDTVTIVCVVSGASSEYNVISSIGNITVN